MNINNLFGTTAGVVIGLFLCVVLFLACRAILLWYWKVDTIVDLLEYQNTILKAIFKQNGGTIDDPKDKAETNEK